MTEEMIEITKARSRVTTNTPALEITHQYFGLKSMFDNERLLKNLEG